MYVYYCFSRWLAGVGLVRCERSVLGRFPKMGSDKNSEEILCKYLLGDTCVCGKHLCVCHYFWVYLLLLFLKENVSNTIAI